MLRTRLEKGRAMDWVGIVVTVGLPRSAEMRLSVDER
jgi:hypothetical protein